MNRPRKSSERKKPGSSRGSSKSTGERGKHPFKKFMGSKSSGAGPKRSSRDRDERKPNSERSSGARPVKKDESRPREDHKQESGRAPSGRRFFKKDEERGGDKREEGKRE